MNAPEKNIENREISVPSLAGCATLANTDGKRGAKDDPNAVWLAVLHGLTIITVGIRKHLKQTVRCEHCGK